MNAVRLLLVLSVALNLVLAIALAWQLSWRAPSPPPPLTTGVTVPSMAVVPRLDVNEPPKIVVGGHPPPLANAASTAVVSPVRVAGDESALDRENAAHLKPVRAAAFERQVDAMKQSLLHVESAEFSKPNIMWQTPPASRLTPGRSTPFSTPRRDEHPVLLHGER